jgi:hypothetical protein
MQECFARGSQFRKETRHGVRSRAVEGVKMKRPALKGVVSSIMLIETAALWVLRYPLFRRDAPRHGS